MQEYCTRHCLSGCSFIVKFSSFRLIARQQFLASILLCSMQGARTPWTNKSLTSCNGSPDYVKNYELAGLYLIYQTKEKFPGLNSEVRSQAWETFLLSGRGGTIRQAYRFSQSQGFVMLDTTSIEFNTQYIYSHFHKIFNICVTL